MCVLLSYALCVAFLRVMIRCRCSKRFGCTRGFRTRALIYIYIYIYIYIIVHTHTVRKCAPSYALLCDVQSCDAYIYVCIYTHTCTHTRVRTHTCMYICVCIRTYMYTSTHKYIYSPWCGVPSCIVTLPLLEALWLHTKIPHKSPIVHTHTVRKCAPSYAFCVTCNRVMMHSRCSKRRGGTHVLCKKTV